MEDKIKEDIFNKNNYYKNLNINNYNQYISKYIDLINEFLIHCCDNIIIQNYRYYLFIHERGINSIKHIFNNLLYHTKNIDLSFHHCKKAYLYYVEFISQIGEDNNSFLQLTSQDATLFLYKKTIYEINNQYKKKSTSNLNEKKIFNLIHLIINIYNKLIIISMDKLNLKNIEERKKHFIYIEKECSKIINYFFVDQIHFKKYTNFCTSFLKFLDIIDIRSNLPIDKFYNLCNLFLNKMINKKKEINSNIINKKLCMGLSNNIIEDLSSIKYINWLFNGK
jgi:hypothetical protein